MKHPRCPPEYHVFKEDSYYKSSAGVYVRYIVIHRKPDRDVAQLDAEGSFWEVFPGEGSNRHDFPSLDEALMYVEAKMDLGILGEKE